MRNHFKLFAAGLQSVTTSLAAQNTKNAIISNFPSCIQTWMTYSYSERKQSFYIFVYSTFTEDPWYDKLLHVIAMF